MPIEYKPKVKFFITTKADYATDKVNEWLENNYNHIDVIGIQPIMSYTSIKDTGVYMIGCMVQYLEVQKNDKIYVEDAPLSQEELASYGMNFEVYK